MHKLMSIAAVALGAAAWHVPAHAVAIVAGDDPATAITFQSLEFGQVKAAEGGLDLILMTGQNGVGVLNNEFGGNPPTLDVDDANGAMPTGGTSETPDEGLFYLTTIGEIRAYYDQAFGPGVVDRLVIFIDMQQAQQLSFRNDLLEVVLNPENVTGNPDPSGDLTTAQQEAIVGFSGGTVLASTAFDVIEPQTINAGNAWADWAAITQIDPYDPIFNDSDTLLFHLIAGRFTAAAETLFLSGTATVNDIPEPETLGLLGLGLAAAGWFGSRRRSRV
jgi:hypothetical protein